MTNPMRAGKPYPDTRLRSLALGGDGGRLALPKVPEQIPTKGIPLDQPRTGRLGGGVGGLHRGRLELRAPLESREEGESGGGTGEGGEGSTPSVWGLSHTMRIGGVLGRREA